MTLRRMLKERFKIIAASYLVLMRDDEVLLLRRFNTGYQDGRYSLPAGHVEAGETALEAVIRETKEESNIVLRKEDVRMAHLMHRVSDLDASVRLDIFFVAEHYAGTVAIGEPDKCDDLSWFPIDQLPENTIPYVRHALECIRRGEIYSELGFE